MEGITKSYVSIGVLGAGAWGTALALMAARNAQHVHLWTRNSAVAGRINSVHENPGYLPSVVLPTSLSATTELAAATSAEALLVVVPAQSVRDILMMVAQHTRAKPIVLCAKGIEKDSGLLLTEILAQVLPDANGAILSGP